MTPQEAAQWMVNELARLRFLDQSTVAYYLVSQDKSLVYTNENGNLAISRDVLNAFRDLKSDDVVWSRGDRQWRFRQAYDALGRMQD
jgi:hypothetical protein